jgi:NADP-dependent 3-hydroxy acid dehydrogenase YdfG
VSQLGLGPAPVRGVLTWNSAARVWVTGASSGIGAALARELANRGASVAISARDVEKLREVAADRMLVVPVDVTDRAATVAAGGTVRAALGGLDAAVLNAGTWSRFRPEKWDSEAFADQLQTNLMGTIYALEAVVPTMLADGRGRIVGRRRSPGTAASRARRPTGRPRPRC